MNEQPPQGPKGLEAVTTPLSKAEVSLEQAQGRMKILFLSESEGAFAKEHERAESHCLKMAQQLVDEEYMQILGSIPTDGSFGAARQIAIALRFQNLMLGMMGDFKQGKGRLPPSMDK